MKTEWVLTKEAFDMVLAWLDEDRDRAAEKYEDIRRKLIKIFARRGCPNAEELADETMNRVCRRVHEVAPTYVGDPALYFYGVAKNVYRESVATVPDPIIVPIPDPPDERRHDCLDRCLEHLDAESRELILEYFQEDKTAKIIRRKELSDRLGISLNNLRMRIHRIKETLQQCVGHCLTQTEAG